MCSQNYGIIMYILILPFKECSNIRRGFASRLPAELTEKMGEFVLAFGLCHGLTLPQFHSNAFHLTPKIVSSIRTDVKRVSQPPAVRRAERHYMAIIANKDC